MKRKNNKPKSEYNKPMATKIGTILKYWKTTSDGQKILVEKKGE